MFISKASELRRTNAALHAQMATLLTEADTAKRALTTEENTKWSAMDAEYVLRAEEIKKHETAETREKDLGTIDRNVPDDVRGDGKHPAKAEREAERKALRTFISQPPSMWDADTRGVLASMQKNVPGEARSMGHAIALAGRRNFVKDGEELRAKTVQEVRALTAAANTTIAEEFMAELDVAMKDFSGILQACRVVNTETGADMPWPTATDTANTGALLAEAGAANDATDPTLSEVVLQSFLYTSKIVRVPNQLLQDASIPFESELAKLLGIRLGRILNTHGTLGTGSSQPRGIVTALMADTTPTVPASATAIAYADLVKLQHATDPAYRNQPKVAWMMHDKIVESLKKLVDGESRPLWAGGSVTVGTPDRLLGHPWFVNQDMDNSIAEDKETVIFGDFSQFIVRRALNPVLIRLNERYAEYFQTGFVMFERWDSDLINGAANPLAVMTHNLA